MTGGPIDVSQDLFVHPELGRQPLFEDRVLVPPPIDPNVHNEIDETADSPVKNKRQKLMHRTEVVEKKSRDKDVCEIHGLRKVEEKGGKTWKCRK